MSKDFSISKFIKAAHQNILYCKDDKWIYLCDATGSVAVRTGDTAILNTLRNDAMKCGKIKLTENNGISQIFNQYLGEYTSKDSFTYTDTEIQICYNHFCKKVNLSVFRDFYQDNSIKLLNKSYVEIFATSILMVGNKLYNNPVIMIGKESYGLIMPLKLNEVCATNYKDSMQQLLKYFDNSDLKREENK